ncbi:MAG: CDP-glycerol glycerophosphotransferase family protein [Planctomycetota bacterium]
MIVQAEEPAVISLSNDAALWLKKASIAYTDFAEYISRENFRNINDLAVESVRKWYKQEDISEVCTFENVNMGEFSELFLTGYFIEVFKKLVILQKIYACHHPSKIIYSSGIEPFNMGLPENLWARVIDAFAQKDNIETLALHRRHRSVFILKEKLKYWLEKHHLLLLVQGGVLPSAFRVYLRYIIKRFKGEKNSGKNITIFAGPADLLTGSVKLMDVLREKGYSVKVLVRENFQARKFFLKHAISAETFTEVRIDRQHEQEIRDKIKCFKADARNRKVDIKKLKPFFFDGINIWPIIAERIFYELKYVYPRLIEEMGIFSYMISKGGIRCIIVPTSVSPDARAILKQASIAGIPTVEIQHGVTKWSPSYLPLIADAVFVWGQMTKDWYIKHGADPGRVFIMGRISATRRKEAVINIENLKQRLNLPLNKKIVLVATQPAICIDSLTRFKGNTPTIQAIVDELAELKDVTLVIKLHLSENLSDYSDVRTAHGNVLITKYGDAQDYLKICDVLIVGDSSIAIDAMINNKPVVYINLEGPEDLVDYPRYGAYPVYHRKDIFMSVKAFLCNGSSGYDPNSIREMVNCEDSEAVEKAFYIISSLMEKTES